MASNPEIVPGTPACPQPITRGSTTHARRYP
jgi:hypothetical protein